ncbi:MAG: 7-carboxy-7-deazaguanine synthase QueE [Candidatus Omnitrophica bacterium]|nr:7-carboxy-7-deazaguanine synthase QueE [Candidatus Omnitrophota bacterium]
MKRKRNKLKADLIEIFSSIQGEGLFVGYKQIFVRLAGCNLRCVFCDTKTEAKIKGVSPNDVLRKVKYLDRAHGEHHAVSLTGGEPLLHTAFLKELLPKLKRAGFKIYLETNGTLYKELKQLIKYIDFVAMDFKLPSSTAMAPLWRLHKEFLKIASKKKVFVKAVVTNKTHLADVLEAGRIIEKISKDIIFILQPATPVSTRDKEVSHRKLSEYRHISAERLTNVRVIPQMHKIMGIR